MCETKIGVTAGKKKRPPAPSVEPEGRLCPSKNLARASKRDFVVPLPLCTMGPYTSLAAILSSTCGSPVLLDLSSLLIPDYFAAPRLIFQSDRRHLIGLRSRNKFPEGQTNTLGDATPSVSRLRFQCQGGGTEGIRPTADLSPSIQETHRAMTVPTVKI